MSHPKVGENVIHEGVTTTWTYDGAGNCTVEKTPFINLGVLIEIGPGGRCEIQLEDGGLIDNIHIGDLKRTRDDDARFRVVRTKGRGT